MAEVNIQKSKVRKSINEFYKSMIDARRRVIETLDWVRASRKNLGEELFREMIQSQMIVSMLLKREEVLTRSDIKELQSKKKKIDSYLDDIIVQVKNTCPNTTLTLAKEEYNELIKNHSNSKTESMLYEELNDKIKGDLQEYLKRVERVCGITDESLPDDYYTLSVVSNSDPKNLKGRRLIWDVLDVGKRMHFNNSFDTFFCEIDLENQQRKAIFDLKKTETIIPRWMWRLIFTEAIILLILASILLYVSILK